ncbi:MAG: hypothetical protein O7A04_07440, partial [Acidobacteria bacterium]|nr:hypothetical protein [Acidobacteriota bacterium]
VFAPPLPPLGLSVWHLEPGTEPPASALEATARGLANDLYRLELNAAGEIASLVDRRSGTELLAAPLRLELLPDRSRRWPAWEILHRDIGATPTPLGNDATIALVESGPVRAVLEVSRRYAGSTYRQRITLAAGDAGQRIEIDLDVDWRSRARLLKAALRQCTTTPEAIYGLGCGTVRRGVNSPAKYEVPGLWAAPTSGGLALIAEGQSGWDRPDEGTLRLSLLRSPGVGRRFRHQASQDHGRHHLRFALTSHEDPATTDEHASRFANRPTARPVRSHPGALGRTISLLEVGRGALVRALKKPEEGSGMVLRLQETGGRRLDPLRIKTPATVRQVTRLDGSEQEPRAASPLPSSAVRATSSPRGTPDEPAGAGVELELGPYALRTLRLDLAPPATSPPRPRHEPLALPYDIRATSAQGEAGVPFGTDGHSLPAELWPSSLQVGAVPFTLGPATSQNALACAGQELRWRPDARRLYLLAASIDRRRTAVLELGKREVRLEVDRWDGIIGRWKGWRRGLKHLQWARPGGGFLRDHRIAWVATHRHDATGSDEPYEYGYLFRYYLDLEPGEEHLVLPATPEIVFFAATLETGAT